MSNSQSKGLTKMFKGVSKVPEDMKDAFRPAKVQERARSSTNVSTLTQGSSEVKLGEITPNIKQVSGMA